MKEKIHGLLVVALIVLGIIWFTPLGDYGTTQVQKERVEILERAKNSSDPEILKQAELVRRDISQEYNDGMVKQNTSESESSKQLSKLFGQILLLMLKAFVIGALVVCVTEMRRLLLK